MPSLHDRLAAARRRFEGAGIAPDEAAIDAEVLARHVLGWDRARLITRVHEPPPSGFDAAFDRVVGRRAAREPVAQITGAREFWNLEFEITPDVLVPRPETELVVELALSLAASGHRAARIVDVGTGSGCLAVALASELPDARVAALDVSLDALRVARRNAARHGVAARVSFAACDLLDGLGGAAADLIVSNPPYVPARDAGALPPEVVRYEPHRALFAGEDGLDAIRRLLRSAPDHLAGSGRLVVEFGFGQAEEVSALAARAGWRDCTIARDLQGIPRVAVLGR